MFSLNTASIPNTSHCLFKTTHHQQKQYEYTFNFIEYTINTVLRCSIKPIKMQSLQYPFVSKVYSLGGLITIPFSRQLSPYTQVAPHDSALTHSFALQIALSQLTPVHHLLRLHNMHNMKHFTSITITFHYIELPTRSH